MFEVIKLDGYGGFIVLGTYHNSGQAFRAFHKFVKLYPHDTVIYGPKGSAKVQTDADGQSFVYIE